MRSIYTIIALGLASMAISTPTHGPENALLERQDSGCFPFEDPDCCIDYAVCQCSNGWFYEYNADEGGCNPPWGIYGTSENAVPGFCCG